MTITSTFNARLNRLFFVFFFGLSILSLKAQNIPDANFAAAIWAVCPECINASNNLTYAALFISHLDVSNKNISNLSGIRGFSSLNTLNCSYNNLTTIPTLPSWLLNVNCRNNVITTLPTVLPLYLSELNCANNPIGCLPCLPESMTSLTIGSSITCLPNMVAGLTVYNAAGSIITPPLCAPTIINAPSVPIDLCVGSSATISTRANGGVGLTIKWQRKSPTDADYVDVTTAVPYTSNTIATYTTPALSNASNGTRYRAIFTSNCPVITEPAVIRMSSGYRIPDLFFLNAVRRDCPSCIDACGNISSLAADRLSLNLDNLATFQYITDLSGIEYFTSLRTLIISNNNISRFPSLPSTLRTLKCVKSGLTALPRLPDTLEVLICTGNKLTSLPTLPSTLDYLDCYDNKLTALPTLPSSLTVLYCATNPLSNLPALPNSLRTLYCYKNNLTALPTLPSSLVYLNCGNNNLTQLPTLPTRLVTLVCSTNPNLTCLPTLPTTLRELYITETNIRCLPNTNAILRTFNPANNAIPMPPMCTTPSTMPPPSVSVTANLGETATLTAGAAGTDEMTVKWRKKPVNAPQFVDIPNSAAPYVPHTNATYTTSPLTVTDNGTQYTAVFSNACFGSAAAQPITVNVSTMPLPVELTAFTGTAKEGVNKLAWETAMQSKLSHFDVERSENGNNNWLKLGKINAQKDSKSALFYTFDDVQPVSVSYYRLAAVDLDGTVKYSKTIALTQKTSTLRIEKLYPNPVGTRLQINFSTPQAGSLTMTLLNVLGRVIHTTVLTAKEGYNMETIDMSNVPNGVYFIRLNDGKLHTTHKIIKR